MKVPLTLELFIEHFYNKYTQLLRKCVREHKDFDLFHKQFAELKKVFIEEYNNSILKGLYTLTDLEWTTKENTNAPFDFSPFNHFNLIMWFGDYKEIIDLNKIEVEYI